VGGLELSELRNRVQNVVDRLGFSALTARSGAINLE